MKFKKVKMPPWLELGSIKVYLTINNEACVSINGQSWGVLSGTLGPRSAVKLARWLIQYAKYQSLQK